MQNIDAKVYRLRLGMWSNANLAIIFSIRYKFEAHSLNGIKTLILIITITKKTIYIRQPLNYVYSKYQFWGNCNSAFYLKI